MKVIPAALLLMALTLTPVRAGPLEDAMEAYAAGDFTTAASLLAPLAAEGITMAQHNLGVMYARGLGVSQSYAEAMHWYRAAAEAGNPGSAHNLGVLYELGRGTPRDPAEAAKWYQKAADQGFGPAQNNLGALYAQGMGVPQDTVTAQMWFALAANQGDGEAARNSQRALSSLSAGDRAKALTLACQWVASHPGYRGPVSVGTEAGFGDAGLVCPAHA